mgnify:FL=1
MNTIITLLAVIALSEVSRLLLTHKPTTRKGHFKGKLDGVSKMIWDLEFKVFKTREIREDIRQEYDFMVSRVDNFDKTIASWPEKGDAGELARVKDQKVLAERDRDRLLAQVKQLDAEISGMKPTNENPDGAIGITEQIDSMRELQTMLKDFIKSI